MITQENKELLLKDLCARLPYGVKARVKYYDMQTDEKLKERVIVIGEGNIGNLFRPSHWVDCKPYLRPMSSMTEEEKSEFNKIVLESQNIDGISSSAYVTDWLYSKHFDMHGLLPKGLALEVEEGMYKTE